MTDEQTITTGGCLCGEVRFEVRGPLRGVVNCHCSTCGSSLFWEPFELDATGIIAGSLDGPTRLETIGHIFVGEKSDFYEITDELPMYESSSNGELVNDYK